MMSIDIAFGVNAYQGRQNVKKFGGDKVHPPDWNRFNHGLTHFLIRYGGPACNIRGHPFKMLAFC